MNNRVITIPNSNETDEDAELAKINENPTTYLY